MAKRLNTEFALIVSTTAIDNVLEGRLLSVKKTTPLTATINPDNSELSRKTYMKRISSSFKRTNTLSTGTNLTSVFTLEEMLVYLAKNQERMPFCQQVKDLMSTNVAISIKGTV